LLTILIQFL